MFVNGLVKQFVICLGVIVILLLNVMEMLMLVEVGGALLDRPCVSKSSFHKFCLCFCMSEVISSFKSLRAGS